MTLTADSYFKHLKAYLNDEYVVHDGVDGKVELREKYFVPDDPKPKTRLIELNLPGPGLAFKLDQDEFSAKKQKAKPALFHFLDDTGKPWSKRCDFVVFYVNRRAFHADCIEFKSKNLTSDKIVPQLKAGACWVSALKKTIENYTAEKRKIRLRKFVFGENENPGPYIDANGQLNADPSIRYLHFDQVHGQALSELPNASMQEI